jgi:hypothetical protein
LKHYRPFCYAKPIANTLIIKVLFPSILVLACPFGARASGLVEVTGWQTSESPFGASPGAFRISAATTVDQAIGTRASLTWSCASNGATMAVGITNGNLDIQTRQEVHRETHYNHMGYLDPHPQVTVHTTDKQYLKVQEQIDRDGKPLVLEVTPESARRFQVDNVDPLNWDIKGWSDLFIGFSVNGADLALKIPFHEPVVQQFLSKCIGVRQGATKRNGRPVGDPPAS